MAKLTYNLKTGERVARACDLEPGDVVRLYGSLTKFIVEILPGGIVFRPAYYVEGYLYRHTTNGILKYGNQSQMICELVQTKEEANVRPYIRRNVGKYKVYIDDIFN